MQPVPTNRATEADQEVVASSGVGVRRFQTWRRLGLVPGPVVQRLGRGRGTQSTYPEGTADRVAEIAALVDRARSLHTVVLGVFGTGRTPTERAVRDAYAWTLDRWEAAGVEGLAHFGEDTFSVRVRRFAAALGRDDPATLTRWNAHARAKARAERSMIDEVTGRKVHSTSRDVRERQTQGFLEHFVDPESGDASPIFSAMGLTDDAMQAIDDFGGAASFGELRDSLDATTFVELVEVRDTLRAGWQQMIAPLMPRGLADYFAANFDDPLSGGLYIALGIPSGLVLSRRPGLGDSIREEGSA
jgi:hypothetical protein